VDIVNSRANGHCTEAVDASVDAYRHGEEGKKVSRRSAVCG
jgi:hypothetical protein